MGQVAEPSGALEAYNFLHDFGSYAVTPLLDDYQTFVDQLTTNMPKYAVSILYGGCLFLVFFGAIFIGFYIRASREFFSMRFKTEFVTKGLLKSSPLLLWV